MKTDVSQDQVDLFDAERLPPVPRDRAEVIARGRQVVRRVADTNRAECHEGLREVAQRGEARPNELGDLGPNPLTCRELAARLERVHGFIAHLGALLQYAEATRAVLEEQAVQHLDDAHDEVVKRTKRGLIPDEAYPNVRRFGAAHGEAVSQGLARAAKLRAEVEKAARKNPPANDAQTPEKNGTNDT